jgi:hypothetical protein
MDNPSQSQPSSEASINPLSLPLREPLLPISKKINLNENSDSLYPTTTEQILGHLLDDDLVPITPIQQTVEEILSESNNKKPIPMKDMIEELMADIGKLTFNRMTSEKHTYPTYNNTKFSPLTQKTDSTELIVLPTSKPTGKVLRFNTVGEGHCVFDIDLPHTMTALERKTTQAKLVKQLTEKYNDSLCMVSTCSKGLHIYLRNDVQMLNVIENKRHQGIVTLNGYSVDIFVSDNSDKHNGIMCDGSAFNAILIFSI